MRSKEIDVTDQIIKRSFRDKIDLAGKPYIEHIERVWRNVPSHGPNDETTVIAMLHDLLEDCPEWNEKALRCLFSDDIVDNVVVLTKKRGEKYEDYISRIVDGSYWAKLVKKADLEDNMDIRRLPEITDRDVARLRKYHAAYQRIVESLK